MPDNFIGKGRPGGKTGNTANVSAPDDATRKARPTSGAGYPQSTGTKGNTDDATRKARPKASGSGQSTATGPGKTP
jgi:hypothetical protein